MLKKLLSKVLTKAARVNVDSASSFWMYQPEAPESLEE